MRGSPNRLLIQIANSTSDGARDSPPSSIVGRAPGPPWAVPAVLALGVASGGVVLAYEVLWTRELLIILGSTTRASAATLGAFMAGIALGSWIAGRWCVQITRPLWFYAVAEALLAVFGFLFHSLLGLISGGLPGGIPFFAAIVGLILLPSVLMGVALPALAAALQDYGADRSRHVARLYGFNTLGAAVAALAVGFGFLPAFGVSASAQGTAAMGAVAAGLAAMLGMRKSAAPRPTAEAGSEPGKRLGGITKTVLGLALFSSGVAALGYEVLWTRTLVLVVGSSTNAFTLMLGLYVMGLGIGGLWVGRYIGRLEEPAAAFQRLQVLVAAMALAGSAIFGYLPQLALQGFAWLGTSSWSIALVNSAVAAIIILPPTIFIGASLPIAARLMERRVPRRGRELGTALALVTGGNVLGVLVAAFGLIPMVGLQRGVAVLAMLNLVAALLLWVVKVRRSTWRGYLVPAAALGVLVAAPAVPSWDSTVMTSGVFRQAPVYLALLGDAGRLRRAFTAYKTVYYREGTEAVVAVFDRPTLEGKPHRVLTIDGKVDASTGSDMATQLLSGHLPFLFRPDAENALVIGLASGVTVGALSRHPLKWIDVVEIEPAVVEAARAFDDVSGAPLRDPRVRITIDDGRRYLEQAATLYDVIVSEPSNPWLSMSARLFTREFFTLVRRRLAPGGLLVQWVPLYGLSASQFKTLLRTLSSVFPNLSIFRVAEGDLVVIASPEKPAIHPEVLDEIFGGDSGVVLRAIGVSSPADLVSRWVADESGLGPVLGRGPINTDDNGLLEFGSPWYLLRDTVPVNLAVINRASGSSAFMERIAEAWSARADGPAMFESLARLHLAGGRAEIVRDLAASLRSRALFPESDLLLGDAAAAEGRWSEADGLWRRHDIPKFLVRRARVAFRRGEPAEVARLFARVAETHLSVEDRLLFALALAGTGRDAESLKALGTETTETVSAAEIMSSFLKSLLLGRRQDGRHASAVRRRFVERLGALRRCLERDGCRRAGDSLLSWSRAAPPGIPDQDWDILREAVYLHVTRPLPLYLRGVSEIWLGEMSRARRSLETYLKLLPDEDPMSRAHDLLESLAAESPPSRRGTE